MTDEQIHALWTLQGMQGYETAAFGWYRENVLRFARAIIAAERERCAAECERMVMYPGGRQEAPAHNSVWSAARAIRAMK